MNQVSNWEMVYAMSRMTHHSVAESVKVATDAMGPPPVKVDDAAIIKRVTDYLNELGKKVERDEQLRMASVWN